MSNIKGTWNDKTTLPIKCPECGHTTNELLSKLQSTSECVCGGCRKTIKITGDGLAALKGLKDAITKFK